MAFVSNPIRPACWVDSNAPACPRNAQRACLPAQRARLPACPRNAPACPRNARARPKCTPLPAGAPYSRLKISIFIFLSFFLPPQPSAHRNPLPAHRNPLPALSPQPTAHSPQPSALRNPPTPPPTRLTCKPAPPVIYNGPMTEDQKIKYLQALLERGLEASAAREAGITLGKVKSEYDADPGFFDQAMDRIEEFNDLIEAEAIRRAVDGVKVPVFYKGEHVADRTEYSDSLLSKLLTGRRAATYGNKHEISGEGGGPLTVMVKSFVSEEDFTL